MKKPPKVLLLGDSIRMSYQPHVATLLAGKAEVVGPEDNCQYALYTLASLERWFHELGTPDIIHWNNGIHDCGHNPERTPRQIPLDMYRLILDFTLQRIVVAKAHVIWATTTPVHPARPFRATEWSWRNEEIDAYNAAALDLMRRHDIPVNDLHGVVWSDPDKYLDADQVHLSPAGQNKCAEAVVDALRPFLGVRA